MAEEKTILTVDLYDNVLTEKAGDYTGKIRITGTTRTSDISNRIVKKRTEYRPETITNILDLSYDEMIEALAQGRCVVNKFGQWLLTINGSFDGKKSDFRSTENKITVMFTPSATLLKALENIYVNADVATVHKPESQCTRYFLILMGRCSLIPASTWRRGQRSITNCIPKIKALLHRRRFAVPAMMSS